MLRVHVLCILAGSTCIKVRPTCECSFFGSPIPKEKPVGGAVLILPWYLEAGRPLGSPRSSRAEIPPLSDWSWTGKQEHGCFYLSFYLPCVQGVAQVAFGSVVLGFGQTLRKLPLTDVMSSVLAP